MQNYLKIIFLTFTVLIISCSSNKEKISILEDENLELQMIDAYKEGYKELEKGDVLYAAKKFNEAELLFPQSEWAPRSVLLSAYAYYSQNYYDEAFSIPLFYNLSTKQQDKVVKLIHTFLYKLN